MSATVPARPPPPIDAATQALLAALDAQRDLLVADEQQLVQMRWSLLSQAVHRLAPAAAAAAVSAVAPAASVEPAPPA